MKLTEKAQQEQDVTGGDNNAVVTYDIMFRALKPLGVTSEEGHALFSKIDENMDGVLTETEFKKNFGSAMRDLGWKTKCRTKSLACSEILDLICQTIRSHQPTFPNAPPQLAHQLS